MTTVNQKLIRFFFIDFWEFFPLCICFWSLLLFPCYPTPGKFLHLTGPKFRELCLKDRITMFGALPNLQVPSLRHRTRVHTKTKFHKFTKNAGRKTGDSLHFICTKMEENVIVFKTGRCLQTRSTSKNKRAALFTNHNRHFTIFFLNRFFMCSLSTYTAPC